MQQISAAELSHPTVCESELNSTSKFHEVLVDNVSRPPINAFEFCHLQIY